MQEGDINRQQNQPPGGPEPGPAPGPGGPADGPDAPPGPPSDGPPPPPPGGAPGGGSNLKLAVLSIIGVVLLAAAAVAAYALLGLGNNTDPEAPEITPPPETEASPSPSPSGLLTPGEQVAQLEPLGAAVGDVSGEAARSTADGRFVLAVSVDLPDPPAGSFYEVFLVHPVSESRFSAGKLYQVGDRWVMTLDQARDASEYSQVLVTQETRDDGEAEETILTGTF